MNKGIKLRPEMCRRYKKKKKPKHNKKKPPMIYLVLSFETDPLIELYVTFREVERRKIENMTLRIKKCHNKKEKQDTNKSAFDH